MKNFIYLFLAVALFTCSSDDNDSNNVNGTNLNIKLYDLNATDFSNPTQEINLNTTLSLIQIGCNSWTGSSADFPALEAFDEDNFGSYLDFWFHIDSPLSEGVYEISSTSDCTERFENGYESTIAPDLFLFDGDLIFDSYTTYEFFDGNFEITQVSSNSISYSFNGSASATDIFSDDIIGYVAVTMSVNNVPYETQ
tara:strand:+ start:273 stop:860 length:588 start_codon:yes stop_codon:yes gene_type:complete